MLEGWLTEAASGDRMRCIILYSAIAAVTVVGIACSQFADGATTAQQPVVRFSSANYKRLMNQLAEAWNANDARRPVDLFTNDAVYSAPPEGPVRRGRQELFRFFGGPTGRPRPMRMEWHHLMFDEESQIGAGECTFTYEIRTHGTVIVRVVNGRIANWREHEKASPLDWDAFIGPNRF
jgi:SnoaL-like domain